MLKEVEERIRKAKIIPVAVVSDCSDAVSLVHALKEGKIGTVEFAFRTLKEEEGYKKIASCIAMVKKSFPSFLTGAGTVTNPHLAQLALEAGADFLVSPGFNPETAKWCAKKKAVFFPGVCTPSEIEQAISLGFKILKFFPAEAMGGINFLKSISGPFPNVSFIPTGGIDKKNYEGYLSLSNCVAVGGSWLCPESAIREKDWNLITQLCLKTPIPLF